jgi:hypothetical protein
MAAIAQMHPGMMGPGVPAPPPYYTGQMAQMGPNPHQMMASGMPGTSAPAPGMATMMKPGAAPVQAEEPPKKRKRISKKQQQKVWKLEEIDIFKSFFKNGKINT